MPDTPASRLLGRVSAAEVGQPAPDTTRASAAAPEGDGLSDLVSPVGMLGGAALAAAALAARNPGAVGRMLSRLGTIRQQLMLTGMAIPKAVVGNIGGAAIASAERGSMNPLKQLLSRQTLRDIGREYRTGAQGHIQTQAGAGAMHGPGRVLGAIDNAMQSAMGRAGLTAKEAERLTFQTPLNERFGDLGSALDSPAARYLIPFRRTPFNVLYEGVQTLKPENLKTPAQRALMAASVGAGAVHGGATSDSQFPMSLGLGAAGANRYALPYLLAASGGRALMGGRNPESVASEALPISEYGLASGITHPVKPFVEPAAVRLLNRALGGQ